MNPRSLLALVLCLLLLTGCGTSPQAEPIPATESAVTEAALEPAQTLPAETAAMAEEVPEPTEYVPMEPITVEGKVHPITYPGEFGQPLLGAEAVHNLRNANTQRVAEEISHVGDALLYFSEQNIRDPKTCVQLFNTILHGDYPYVGLIEIAWDDNLWIVATLGLEGRYYAFDPFNPDLDYTTRPENGCSGVSDLYLLGENVANSWIYPGTNLERIKVATDPHTQLTISYPEFQRAVLAQEAVTALYRAKDVQAAAEAITTVADAYYYLECGGPYLQPKPVYELFLQLLEGDFEYIGVIELRYLNEATYFLPYILQDGVYYAVDPFSSFSKESTQVTSTWVIDPRNGCRSNEDLYALVAAAAEAYPQADAGLRASVVSMDVADYVQRNYPQLAGNVLGQERVAALCAAGDICAASQSITSIADALYYVRLLGLPTSKECCDVLNQLLAGDYDFLGALGISNGYNGYLCFILKQDGLYYGFDPYSGGDWTVNPQNNCFGVADFQTFQDGLLQACPYLGPDGDPTGTLWVGYDTTMHGAEVYAFAGMPIPVGLGQPEYDCQQIEAMIAAEDYAMLAEKISTFPDAAHLFRHLKIAFNENLSNNRFGEFNYFASAWHNLENRNGTCVTTSNLFHYLLQDNYEEVGYVQIRSPGDGHVMFYIHQDGVYYVINSLDYSTSFSGAWFYEYPAELIASAEDFQTIADSIMEHMTIGDNKPLNLLHLVRTGGDFISGNRNGKNLYPEGSIVTEFYGKGFVTAPATHRDWQSQTRLD